jgi:molybdopterin-guanine dinucleotide biosynthesis protein A
VTAAGHVPGFDAVILAGGRAARMEGADKPGLEVAGTARVVLVARAAAAAGASRLIVVGPRRPGPVQAGLAAAATGLAGGLVQVREEPAGGGPVPALRRGLADVQSPWLAVLAADLPFLTSAELAGLLRAAWMPPAAEAGKPAPVQAAAGAVLTDADGRPQWLAGVWQTGALRRILAPYEGSSLGGVFGPLDPVLIRPGAVQAAAPPWLDCDTPADLAAARALAGTRVPAAARGPAGDR